MKLSASAGRRGPRLIATPDQIAAAMTRIGRAVRRRNPAVMESGRIGFVGIRRRGFPLAAMLARLVGTPEAPVGAIDITLYRDDLQMISETPIVRGTDVSFDINGRLILLVDDVIFTGRTVRAALTELLDYGRPQAIQLAVLVDRGHRELPIQPDFVGISLRTEPADLVDIFLAETDGTEGIYITNRADLPSGGKGNQRQKKPARTAR